MEVLDKQFRVKISGNNNFYSELFNLKALLKIWSIVGNN